MCRSPGLGPGAAAGLRQAVEDAAGAEHLEGLDRQHPAAEIGKAGGRSLFSHSAA